MRSALVFCLVRFASRLLSPPIPAQSLFDISRCAASARRSACFSFVRRRARPKRRRARRPCARDVVRSLRIRYVRRFHLRKVPLPLASRIGAFNPLPGLLACVSRIFRFAEPTVATHSATQSTDTIAQAKLTQRRASRTRANSPFPGLLAFLVALACLPVVCAVRESPVHNPLSLVTVSCAVVLAAAVVDQFALPPPHPEQPTPDAPNPEPTPNQPPYQPEEISREPESISRTSTSSTHTADDTTHDPIHTPTAQHDSPTASRATNQPQDLSGDGPFPPASVLLFAASLLEGDTIRYEVRHCEKTKWDKRVGTLKISRADGALLECMTSKKQSFDELFPEQQFLYRRLVSSASVPETPAITHPSEIRPTAPQVASARQVRGKTAGSTTAAASAEFELEDLKKQARDETGKTKQREANAWTAILRQEDTARIRLRVIEARAEATRREEARRANEPMRPAPAPPTPHQPPPDLDEARLNLWTVLPQNLSKALVDHFCGKLATHGGSDAIGRDPGLLREAFAEVLALPKISLNKALGKSGAEQRKLTLQALGGSTPTADEAAQAPQRPERTADDSACARALRFFSLGFLGRAAKAIDSEVCPQLPDEIAFEKLCALHPAAVLDMPRCCGSGLKTLVDPEALHALIVKMANGAAAGPDGWTEDLLAPLLSDADVLQFVTAVTQSLVDGVAPCSRKRVVASRLVGITKPDGGIRPLAVGTIWLKIAARYLLSVHGDAVLKYFAGLQFGCGEENGAEIVIHRTRRAHEDGETVCTIDARNAFNSPCRVALWKAASSLPCLAPFLGIFALEYQAPSDLIWHGRSCTRLVKSSRGTRQGSVLGGVFFSALIHPVLLECRRLFPEVSLYGFLDDITLTSRNDEQLAQAFLFLKAEFAKLLLDFNSGKCEILLRAGASLPESLVAEVSIKEDGVIKVLGAFIGDAARCSEKLVEKQKRHNHFFRRVVLLAGPAAFAVLSACGVPRASYFVRTHNPDVSAAFVDAFENQLCAATVAITNARLDDETRLMAHLPRRNGGLGITDFRRIAPLAFKASLGQAVRNAFSEPVNCQKVATLIMNTALVEELGPLKKAIIKETKTKGCATWLVENALWVASHFAAAIRYKLGAAAADDPANLECAPCAAVLSAEDHPTHVTGCVRRSGKNATKKHNRLVDIGYGKLRSVGVVCEKEPRDYKAFVCSGCGGKFSKEDSIVHARACRNARFRPTGPDLRVEWGASADNALDQENIVYDWTVVHATAPSHRGSSLAALFAAKAAEKEALYGEMVRANGEKFVVLCISSHGVMSKETLAFVARIAAATGKTKKEIRASLLVALHQHNGAAIAQSRGRRWDK